MSAANSDEHPVRDTGATETLRDTPPRTAWLPDERPSPEQVEIYRRMTPGRRLEIAEGALLDGPQDEDGLVAGTTPGQICGRGPNGGAAGFPRRSHEGRLT